MPEWTMDALDILRKTIKEKPLESIGHCLTQTLILICYSAKPHLGHHALVRMVGFRMTGFMLSGCGIRVFVLGIRVGWMGKSTSQ